MVAVMSRRPRPENATSPAGDTKRPSRGQSAPPRRMTARRLENIAMFYLQRFSATGAHLKRVLMRRVDRAMRAPESPDRREMTGWVDALVERLVASGAVSDAAYAEGRTAMMRRLGKGPGKIRSALAAKGVRTAEIDRVLAETERTADGTDATFAAAVAYARRRRLGPFRDDPADRDQLRKDMAALARAGFSFAVAGRVMALTADDLT